MVDRITDFDYTGLHAFVFIDHVPEGTTPRRVVSNLRKLGAPPDGPVDKLKVVDATGR